MNGYIPCFGESDVYPLFRPATIQFSEFTSTSYSTSSCQTRKIMIYYYVETIYPNSEQSMVDSNKYTL